MARIAKCHQYEIIIKFLFSFVFPGIVQSPHALQPPGTHQTGADVPGGLG